MKRVIIFLLALGLTGGGTLFGGTKDIVNALRQAVELETPSDSQIQAVQMIDLGCSSCQKWLGEKEWVEGKNIKEGSEFYVFIDSAQITAPPGHPNYVSSRQNAYAKAFMKAKGKLLQFLQSEVSKEINFNEEEGKFIINNEKPAGSQQGSPQDEDGLPAINRKTLALINAYLDEKLKEKGIKSGSQTAAENSASFAEAAEEVRNSNQFNEIVKSSSMSHLKGVRRIFVSESVKAGEEGEICVIALHSPKTMAFADSILGDETLAPEGIPARPIREQLADWTKGDGVSKLMSTFGTEMLRDENGQFHLVAYGQSGPQSDSRASLNIAQEKARLRAIGELRSFVQEHAVFNSATQSREKAEELVNTMRNCESTDAFEKTLQSISSVKSISGISSIGTWAAKHPLTDQIVVGSIVRWSPSDSRDAKRLRGEINTPAGGQQKSAEKSGNAYRPEAFQTKGSYEGSASGGSNVEDF